MNEEKWAASAYEYRSQREREEAALLCGRDTSTTEPGEPQSGASEGAGSSAGDGRDSCQKCMGESEA